MGLRAVLWKLVNLDKVNFLLTNRFPRHAATHLMGWLSKVELAPVRIVSIRLWKSFCEVDLSDAKPERYRSLHQAFIRELKPGARDIDPRAEIICAPCDGVVGAHGRIAQSMALQIKGLRYEIADLLGCGQDAAGYADGHYLTLRLTAGMYHRFHAPHDCAVEQVRYISGDRWNVNPPTLRRIERLYCRNERAPISVRLDAGGARLMLVPVAAVLVASIRLPWLDRQLDVRRTFARGRGARVIAPTPPVRFAKGEEMGWFEHGSTIIIIAPATHRPVETLVEGAQVRVGQAIMRHERGAGATVQ